MQYQKYEAQELLSGYEYFLGPGSECDLVVGGALNRLALNSAPCGIKQSTASGWAVIERVGKATSFGSERWALVRL